MRIRHWQEEGKCHKLDLPETAWHTEHMVEHGPIAKSIKAKAMCSGCPVIDICGAEALRNRDFATIRAGKAITFSDSGEVLERQYNEIRAMLGRPTGERLRECKICGRTMSPNGEVEGTIPLLSKFICHECHQTQLKEQSYVVKRNPNANSYL